MPKRIVSEEKPEVVDKDFVGETKEIKKEEPRPLMVQPQVAQPQATLTVDERVIPDAGLPTDYVEGILDIATEGSGLLRPKFSGSDTDVYISASQIRRFNLRVGDKIGGQARQPK